jgi:drug/metabolite transporter (DMT)-like permease
MIWGSTWLAIKIGLEGSPPFLGAGFRFIIAASILFIFAALTKNLDLSFAGKRRKVLIAAFLMYPIPYGLVYWGSQFVESGMAAVLFAIMPFFVAILAHYYMKVERLTFLKIFGMLTGFSGLLLIFADNLGARGPLGILGMVAVAGSSFFSSLGTVFSKKHFHDINPISMTAVQSSIGAVVLTALGLIFESVSAYQVNFRTVGSLLYLGIIGTALAFTLYFFVLKRMEATKLALIAFITPVMALFLGMLLRNEHFDFVSALGIVMVIAGVFIVVAGDNMIRRKSIAAQPPLPKPELSSEQ